MDHGTRAIRRPRLYALTGLKVIAVVGVFFWHALPKGSMIDLGARGCELMFAASGFLVAYNRHEWFTSSIGDAFRYLVSKVKKFYALYLLALVLALVVLTGAGKISWLDAQTYLTLPFHLTMTQAWSHRLALAFNTPAWFLSALMVCYGAAPLLAQLIKRMTQRLGARRGMALVFGVLLALRIYLEVCHALEPALFKFSLHTNPGVRFLEFGMAYVAGVAFVRREAAGGLRVQPLAEVAACLLFAGVAIAGDRAVPRVVFVVLALPVVYTLAAEQGPVSRLLASHPFQKASCLEMQFYLLHWDVIHAVELFLGAIGAMSVPLVVALSVVLSVLASLAAQRLFPRVRPT